MHAPPPTPLAQKLLKRLEREGSISFCEFMAAALYDAEHGYYASGRATIGRRGDFFTNVSVGPLFGALLARQAAEMYRALGEPECFSIVEQGAHHGDLAHDLLSALERHEPGCFAAVEYVIAEPVPALQGQQRQRLEHFAGKIRWVKGIEELEAFEGLHLSNELLDAFPVHLIEQDGPGEWRERHVVAEPAAASGFAWTTVPIGSAELQSRLHALPPHTFPRGYRTEICLQTAPWLGAISSRLTRGWILAVDYGWTRSQYYRPERIEGTLSAYANHARVKDPLERPGEIDLTAHVDFTNLAEEAQAEGLALAGFLDQHHFVVGLSSLHFLDEAVLTSERQKELRAFKTLMHPNMLGSAFSAIAFGKNVPASATLTGFRFQRLPLDLR